MPGEIDNLFKPEYNCGNKYLTDVIGLISLLRTSQHAGAAMDEVYRCDQRLIKNKNAQSSKSKCFAFLHGVLKHPSYINKFLNSLSHNRLASYLGNYNSGLAKYSRLCE